MSTLSLDLRGSSPSFPSKPASGASLSLFVHGAGIGALVLVPLLTATAPPETAHSFQAPLVKPITVMLPAPSSPRPRGPRKNATPRAAQAAVADLTPPRDTPTLISASDVLDPGPLTAAGPAGAGNGGTGGAGHDIGVDCALGALCGGSPLAAPTRAPEAPRIGGLIREPKLVESRPPLYPPMAQAAGVSGEVILEAHVGEDGRVIDVRIIEGHRLFDEAALTSVRSRRYEPLLLNGVRSDFLVTITLTFRIRR